MNSSSSEPADEAFQDIQLQEIGQKLDVHVSQLPEKVDALSFRPTVESMKETVTSAKKQVQYFCQVSTTLCWHLCRVLKKK